MLPRLKSLAAITLILVVLVVLFVVVLAASGLLDGVTDNGVVRFLVYLFRGE